MVSTVTSKVIISLDTSWNTKTLPDGEVIVILVTDVLKSYLLMVAPYSTPITMN